MSLYTQLSDVELIALLKKEDKSAFAEIYKRYARKLTDFASTKLYSLDDVSDLIQDLFVGIWTDRHQLSVHSTLQSYLFTAVRYKVIDKIRKNVTREEYAMIVQSLSTYPDYHPEREMEAKDLKNIVDQAIERLSPRTKEIYKLSRDEYQSVAEIAKKLNLSEQTVKNQLTAAMKSLRETLHKLSVLLL